MTSSRLFHLAGWSAAVGGVLMALDVIAHLFVDDTVTPESLLGLPHELWHVPGIVGLVLVLLGLVGIYLRQSEEAGAMGLWGFVLLTIGITIGAVYSSVFHGLFLPAIDSLESGLFEEFVDNTTAAQFFRGVVVQALGLGLGAVLFGWATIRSKVFTAAAGWLFIAAALFAGLNQVFAEGQLISRLLFAAAFVWLGALLMRPSADATS